MERLTENEKKALDTYAYISVLNEKGYSLNFPRLSADRIFNVVARCLKLDTEETKNLIFSSIKKDSKEFTNYFMRYELNILPC